MSVSNRWQAWRCSRGHHAYEERHPAIWNGAYVQCARCGRRDVLGGDAYGPAAGAWKAWGTPPPAKLKALFWGADDWSRWRANARRGA